MEILDSVSTVCYSLILLEPVAQWTEHLATDQGVGGSNPSRLVKLLNWVWRKRPFLPLGQTARSG